jgi:hypothetical protein
MKKLVLLTLGLLFAVQISASAAPNANASANALLKEENATNNISPTGWDKGKKTGWDGGTTPPGLSK